MKTIYDIVGVGFGPSNLALAAALSEQQSTSNLSAIFFEEKDSFKWHPDMLLEDAEMQISFFKDLVTLRNPTSPYSFLNYLYKNGRLAHFANLRKFYPSRIEFNQYLMWVAEQLITYVKYSSKVIDISPCGNSPYNLFEVKVKNKGIISKVLTRNIVIASGGAQKLPEFSKPIHNTETVWHSSSYLSKIKKFKKQDKLPYQFCVVGGGQSAAEIAFDLHKTFSNSTVTCLHRGYAFKPADDSEFVNEIFNPEMVNLFFSMHNNARQNFLDKHYDTNYAVVDAELIQKLYRIMYEETVLGYKRLIIKRMFSLIDLEKTDKGFEAIIKSTISSDHVEKLQFDAMILATGYDHSTLPSYLNKIKKFIQLDDDSNPIISRYYKVNTNSSLSAGIYLQGYCEKTHGLSDTLLSNTSLRAQEILQQIQLLKNDTLLNEHKDEQLNFGEVLHV